MLTQGTGSGAVSKGEREYTRKMQALLSDSGKLEVLTRANDASVVKRCITVSLQSPLLHIRIDE